MKNIHLLPMPSIDTIKNPGDLVRDQYGDIHIFTKNDGKEYGKTTTKLNIYITSDEEIKPNMYALINGVLCKTELLDGRIVSRQLTGGATMDICKSEYSEIILTTDQDLIKDGVQAIYDEFLEWFVKNPSCEIVDIGTSLLDGKDGYGYYGKYKIIIPKEENKQELPKTEIDWSRFPKSTQEQVGYVEPKQYPIGGFAPGYYSCKCVNCKTEFMGDKRAVQCEPCAIKITKEEPNDPTGNNGVSDPNLNEIRLDIPNQETLEHTSKFIVFAIPNCEEWVQHSIPLDSFEKADDFCQQFRDKKMSYLICKTLKQGYNGK